MDISKSQHCYTCGQAAPLNESDYPVCPVHGTLWMLRRNTICGEAFIVRDDGKVLLIKRAHEPKIGYWAIPGGFTDYGEHPHDTAIREALEETGWNIELTGQILGTYLDSFSKDKHSEHRVVVSYLAKPTEKVGEADRDETDGYEWFNPNELPDNIIPTQTNRFKDFLALQ